MECLYPSRVSFRKLSKGGNWRNLDFKGGMMVKDVTKFHKRHLGVWGMLECVFMCRVSYRILSVGREGGTPSSVLMRRGCITHNY